MAHRTDSDVQILLDWVSEAESLFRAQYPDFSCPRPVLIDAGTWVEDLTEDVETEIPYGALDMITPLRASERDIILIRSENILECLPDSEDLVRYGREAVERQYGKVKRDFLRRLFIVYGGMMVLREMESGGTV